MQPDYPKAIEDAPEGELDPLVADEFFNSHNRTMRVFEARMLFDRVDYRFECCRIVHREVCQNLAVEADVLSMDSTHELRVSHTVLTCSGVDTRDPKSAEAAFFSFTVAECIGQTFLIGILGNRPNVFPGEEITAGLFQDFLAASS